jgi:hypothetical protein
MERSVKARDSRNRPVISMSPQEAGVMVANGYAVWDGRKKENIRFSVSKEILLAFVRMMRFRPIPEMRGLDSKTHTKLPGIRGYRHVRNESYGLSARILTDDPMSEDAYWYYKADC